MRARNAIRGFRNLFTPDDFKREIDAVECLIQRADISREKRGNAINYKRKLLRALRQLNSNKKDEA